jgi:protein TonB
MMPLPSAPPPQPEVAPPPEPVAEPLPLPEPEIPIPEAPVVEKAEVALPPPPPKKPEPRPEPEKPKPIKPEPPKKVEPRPEPPPKPPAKPDPQATPATEAPPAAAPPGTTAPTATNQAAQVRDGAAAQQQRVTWQGALIAHLERFKRYPRAAQIRRQEGAPLVAFSMDRNGHILSARLHTSSGYRMLDKEALDLITRAEPLPIPPDSVKGDPLSLVVPIEFFIR